MTATWVDVADNTIKIGLGSFITFLGGYLTMKLTQRHERKKELHEQRLKEIDRKTERYIDFLSASNILVQKYLMTSCNPESSEYIQYSRLLNIIAITSSANIRAEAHRMQAAVSEFIRIRKTNNDDIRIYRDVASHAIASFQTVVYDELTQEKEELPAGH